MYDLLMKLDLNDENHNYPRVMGSSKHYVFFDCRHCQNILLHI